jgi:acetylornithine/N-succinyldiaminopimelate aminotransferase
MEQQAAMWAQEEGRCLLETYKKFPLVLERGEGVHVYSVEGKQYLDFYGGHAVALIGHAHPHLVAALKAQTERLIFYSSLCYLPIRTEAARKLLGILYRNMRRIFFVNSGAEANEAALKLARNHTGRERIVAMRNSFHGRTIATLSVTGMDKYRCAFLPNLAGATDFVPFGDLDALKQLDWTKIAAVILEPVQSMAGAVTAEPAYFQKLRDLTRELGALLIFDEIQTGMGRTGEHFAGMGWGVEPDIVTMAKGIGGGVPVAAAALTEEIAGRVKLADHGTTFGGGPIACAAVKATVEVVEREGLAARARRMGDYVRQRLRAVPAVSEIRGLGLLVGFAMDRPARDIQQALFERGILVGTSQDPRIVRLLPPLVIDETHVDRLVAELARV